MKLKATLIIFIFLLMKQVPSSLFALDPYKRITQYDIRVYTAEDGLPMNSLKKVFQDSRGYIWIGTQEGLVRFDGVEFKLYDKSKYSGLKSNFILDIDEDAQGNLWQATAGGGICCFDGLSFTTYDTSNGLVNNFVNHIIIAKDSSIWAGTESGLSHFKNNQFTNFNTENGLCGNNIQALLEDGSGNIFVGSYGQAGFDIIANKKPENLPGDYSCLSFLKRRSGEIWMGGHAGKVYQYQNGKISVFKPISPNWSHRQGFWDMIEDRNGNVWFCTERDGIYRYSNGAFTGLNLEAFLLGDNNFVISAMEDREGSLWFCGDFGLLRMKDNKFVTVGKQEGLISNFGHTVCEDYSGNICIGFRDPGISKYNRKEVKNIFSNEIAFKVGVTSIIPAQNGGLWIGLENNSVLKWFDWEHKIHYCLEDCHITSLLETAPNELWIGAFGYICRFHNQDSTYFWHDPSANPHSSVTCIAQRKSGEMWYGTRGTGLYRINDEQISKQGITPELAHSGINALYVDPEDILWIGTDNLGLFRLKDGEYTQISVQEGLFCDRIFSILEDDSLNLWCSTNRGIFKVNKPQADDFAERKITRITCTVYNHLDGMRAAECNGRRQPSAWKAQDGRLWFTSITGVVVIDPNNIPKNEKEPPVYIESINTVDSIYVVNSSRFKLAARERDLTIQYTALSFMVPERVTFKYQLEGYEPYWVEAGTRRAAYFTNLPRGKYTFRVKAANNDGVWNKTGATIQFSIAPFWWETWWAFIGYICVTLTFLFWFVRWRYRRTILKTELKLQKEQSNRLEELDRTKSRFFAGVSHEFRTPLTLIKGPLQDLLNDPKIAAYQSTHQMMLHQTTRLERLVAQLLDISQLQHQKLALQVRPVEMVPFLKTIVAAFESYAKRKGIRLRFITPTAGLPIVWFDAEKMEKVVSNLLSNALKFTPSGGEVTVKLTPNHASGKTHLLVRDSGVGIPADALPHIFDYFYRYRDENNRHETGTGIGLALTRELVNLHHGEISVKSTEGEGSEFTVTLLTGKAHFKSEEIADEFPETTPVSAPNEEIFPEELPTRQVPPALEKLLAKQQPVILVVEDNPDMRHYLTEFLAQKFSVVEAADGRAGLARARELIPDLIVSDVMMPHLDGLELCERLIADKLTCHIPVILLTAKGSGECKIEGLERGAVDYLTKPFEKQELLLRIQNLLQLQQAQRTWLRQQLATTNLGLPRLEVPSADAKFLEQVLEIIEDNLGDSNFNAQALAQKINLSRTHLNRKLTGLVNLKTTEFIRLIRLKTAAQLLQKKAGTVSEIAYQVGFNHLSYFAICFKKQYGILPSEFNS